MCLQLFLNITQRDCGERCPRGGSESRRLRAQHGRDQAPVRAGTLAASAVHGRARPNAAPLREGRGGAAALQAGARAADHVCGVAVAAPQVSRKLAETILGARGLSRGGRGPGSAGSGVTLLPRRGSGAAPPLRPQLSKNDLSFRLRLGCFSLRSALASIWRMRSRVTLNCWPTSSNV